MPFLQWVKNGFCIGFQLMEQCNCTVSFIFRGGDDSAQQSGVKGEGCAREVERWIGAGQSDN